MSAPFADKAETSDRELVTAAQDGDRSALEKLLARHQPWVFNITLRMLGRRQDAEDATQDVLIKILEALPSFRGESAFRTWLYRIAVNHVLNLKRDKWRVSESICSFPDASNLLAQVPDMDLPDPRTVPVPVEILLEETRIGCITATLLCLDGRQRLVFILGEILGVRDDVGGEIAGVTPVNFRQILSRARRDLYEYLNGNCSLVNPGAPCQCAKKTRAYIQGGFVDPNKLQFTREHQRRVRDVAEARDDEWNEAYEQIGAALYRDHPFYEPPDQAAKLRQALRTVALDRPE